MVGRWLLSCPTFSCSFVNILNSPLYVYVFKKMALFSCVEDQPYFKLIAFKASAEAQ